jgi:hypothetical protein
MKRIAVVIVLLAVCLALPAPVPAADPVGSATFIQGRVDVTRPGQAAEPLMMGADVYVGDIIRTKTGAKAELTFVDESIIRIAEKSRLEVTEFLFEPKERRSSFNLFRGKIQSLVKKIAGFSFGLEKRNKFEVHTPTAVCGVRGTVFFTWFLNGQSGAAVQEGDTYFYPSNRPDFSQTLAAGQAAVVFSADEPPQIRPATDVEMQQHINDTSPDGEGGSDEQGYVDPGSLPGEGTGTGGYTDYEQNITKNYTPDQPPIPVAENVSGIVNFDFLNNGSVSGLFLGTDTFGTATVSGKVVSTPPVGHYGSMAGTIAAGDFAGFIAGAAGSWDAVFNTLTVTNGVAGLFYGYLESGQTLGEGTGLLATGPAYRNLNLGKARQGLNTVEDLPIQDLPIPLFLPESGEVRGMPLADGRLVAVFGASDHLYGFPDPGSSPFHFTLADVGPDGKYVLFGNLTGTLDAAGHVAMEGNKSILYMDSHYIGDIFPYYRGIFTTGEGTLLELAGTGTYVLDPLRHSGAATSVLKEFDGEVLTETADIWGLFGGTDSLWNTPVDGGAGAPAGVRSIGMYTSRGEAPLGCIWSTEIAPYNAKNGSYATYDGGSYVLYAGGTHQGTAFSGGLAGIYVAPDRSSGLFWGELGGTDYLDASAFLIEGKVQGRARMTGDAGFSPAALMSILETSPLDLYEDWDLLSSGNVYVYGTGSALENTSTYLTLGENKQWGIWKTELFGEYYTPVDNWEFFLTNIAPSGEEIHRWLAVTGYRWSGGKLEADAAGAWVNVDDAVTGVMAGSVEGTYHPDVSFEGYGGYWEGIGGGVLLDTATFLSYVDSKPGVLEAMNVPNIEVGRATLEGTGGATEDMYIKMKDTRFFSYRSGAAPRIWASGSVTGNNPGESTNIGSSVALSKTAGNANVSADFILNNWAGNKWDGSVDGGGTVNSHLIRFKGGAAGRFTGTDLNGTAAGVAGRSGLID